MRRILGYLCLVTIICSVIIRFSYINRFTYEIDESISIIAAHGVAKSGLPYLGGGKLYHRSHLISYLIGLCIKLFGFNPFSIRVTSFMASIVLLILVFVTGRKYFDTQTGLIATLILSISPMQFRYALSARMYGMWELLCFIFIITFFQGFIKDKPKYKILTALFFVLSMFTHGLTVSLLPGLLLFLLFEKRGRIFQDVYLYVCLAIVLFTTYLAIYFIPPPIDYGKRIIIREVGGILAQKAGFGLDFQAGFAYLRNSFIYGYPFAGVFFLNGIRLKWKKTEGKYLIFITIATTIVSLMLIIDRGMRLFFSIIPAYILMTSVGISGVVSYLFELRSWNDVWSDIKQQLNMRGIIFYLLVVFMMSQTYVRLTWRHGVYENLLNAYGIIFRYIPNFSVFEYNIPDQNGAYKYIKNNLKPGDKIASNIPEVAYAYFKGEHCDFAFHQNYTTTSDYDAYTGAYKLSNKDKLMQALAENHRIWFVFVKTKEYRLDFELRDYIIEIAPKVYSSEGSDVEVYLYTRGEGKLSG